MTMALRLAAAPPHDCPEVAEILRRVLAQPANHAANDRLVEARYRYTRTRTFEIRAGDGDLILRDEKCINHVPAHGADGDDDAIVPTDAKGAKGRAYRRADFQITPELLARFTFTVRDREPIAGRAAWVLDFQPARDDLPAKDLKDRFLNRTAGRVWIDTEDAVVVQAAFRLLSPVSLVGGLVGSVRRCDTQLERQRTEQGDWYTRRLDWQLEGRKLFARRTMHLREERLGLKPCPESE